MQSHLLRVNVCDNENRRTNWHIQILNVYNTDFHSKCLSCCQQALKYLSKIFIFGHF